MKKTLSLLLVLAMVLSSFTFAFAEEAVKTPGEVLKDLGVLAGNAEGDLMLDKELLRQDMIVLLSRLYGQEDEAKAFEGKTSFTDVKDSYYVPFMAWAEANKLTKGVGEGLFGFGRPVTTKEVANFMLNALGYTDVKWEDVAEKAVKLDLVAEDADLEANCIRSLMAEITLKALGLKVNGEEKTLAEKLGLELPKPAVSENLELKSVKAIGNDKVEVTLVEGVEAVAPEAFAIVEKGTTTALEVKDAVLESAKVVVLTTAPMTAGKAYTLTAKEVSINFTGIAKDTAAPKINTVKVVDTNTVEIAFDKVLDKESAEAIANYSVNNNVKVVSASLESNRKTVTLTTEGVQKGKLYTLKVEGVKSVDLVAIKAVSKNFVGSVDNTAPKLSAITVKTNTRLYLDFTDDHGVDKATAENIENYSIKDLGIVSVEAVDTDDDGYYDRVVMVTEPQTVGKLYTLTINNLVDGSVSANAITKAITKDFRGRAIDKESPYVTGAVVAETNTTVKVVFSDRSALDVASATDVSNYEINGLTVEKAEIYDDADLYVADGQTVILTTSAQDSTKTYGLIIKGVKDEFGNELKPISGTKYRTYYFRGTAVDTIPPYVKNVTSINSTTVKVEFDGSLDKATAQDPTNYVINGGIGSAVKASLKGTVVTLTTLPQTAGTTYTITINGVADLSDNVLSNVKAKFISLSNVHDVTAPELDYIEALYNDEIRLHFNEEVKAGTAELTLEGVDTTFAYAGLLDDNTTVVMKVYSGAKLGNKSYEVKAINNITDVAGNKYVKASDSKVEFWGTDVANEAPEMTSYEQTDVNTIRVYFNEPVKVVGTKTDWTLNVDPDGDETYEGMCIVDFVSKAKLAVDTKLTFDFTTLITDLVGTPSKENKVEIETYLEDKDAPVLVNVEAKDNQSIALTFDENIAESALGSYKVTYTDDKNVDRTVSLGKITVSDNKVTIKLASGKLESQYVYTLKVVVGARDIAGNQLDARNADTFDFVGTDIVPNYAYITGVVLTSTSTIEVSSTAASTVVATVYEVGADPKVNLVVGTPADNTATLSMPLLADETYEVTLVNGLKYQFTGVVSDYGIEVKEGGVVNYYNKADGDVYKLYNSSFAEISDATTVKENDVVYVVIFDKNETTKVLYGAKVTVIK